MSIMGVPYGAGGVLHSGATETSARRHAFMGLLTCGQCGCAITAERKKGTYVYYHCTDFRGSCGNTYIREERLGELLAGVIKPIQISEEVAADIATALAASDHDAERRRARRSDTSNSVARR
jgi:site-specific DNA recombinase